MFKRNGTFLLILLLATLLRLLFLEDIPFRVDGDASRMALDSLVVWNNRAPLFATGWFGYQNVFFYINALFLKIFGGYLLSARIFSAFGGVISIFATYLTAKELFNKNIAFLSALFLSFLPIHLAFSRNGTDMIHTTWLLPLTLYLVYIAVKRNKTSVVLLSVAGIVMGFSQYFYHAVRFIPFVIIFSFLVLTYRKYPSKELIIGFIFLILSSFLIYGPMLYYYTLHPNTFLSRPMQVSFFLQKGWYKSKIEEQVLNPFLVFFADVQTGKFHYFGKRFLPLLGSILFALGLYISLPQLKKSAFLILAFWLLLGIILGGVLTVNSPQAARYVILLPAVTTFMAIGAEWILKSTKTMNKRIIFMIILGVYTTTSLYAYWQHEAIESFKYDVNAQIATYAGRYLSKEKVNTIYFLGDNNMYYKAIPSLEFLTKKQGVDIFSSLEENLMTFTKGDFFIILLNRETDLVILKRYYPEGRTLEFRNPQGNLLAFLFEI